MTVDPFLAQAMLAGGPGRDGGRPMLVPRGAPAGTRAAYTRASSFTDRVQSMDHIHMWQKRLIAKAIGQRPDLAELAGAQTYVSQKQLPGIEKTAETKANRQSGQALDAVIERALDHAGALVLADRGTSVHAYCESRERYAEAPDNIKPYLDGYWKAVDAFGVKIAATERFVACDEVMAAGTFDCLIWWAPRHAWVMGDWKTGDMAPAFGVQVAIYANGELYDTDNDQRAPLESLTGGEVIDRSVAVIFDIKADRTKVYEVDLEKAWALTKNLHSVLEDLNMDLFEHIPQPAQSPAMTHIAAASDRRDLRARLGGFMLTDAESTAANARWEELS